MIRKSALIGSLVFLIGFAVQAALAQKVEIHPYGGGIFPDEFRDTFDLKNQDPRSRAFIWEAGPSINFFSGRFSNAVPFLSVGVGGVTGFVGDPEDANDPSPEAANIMPVGAPPLILEDGDTFFQFSYGGGLKGLAVGSCGTSRRDSQANDAEFLRQQRHMV